METENQNTEIKVKKVKAVKAEPSKDIAIESGVGEVGEKEEAKSVLEMFTKISQEVESLRKDVSEKDEQIKMLIDLADESRKEKFNSKKKTKIIPRVKLTTLGGKVIISSKTLIDEVYKDVSDKGNWVEKQIHKYTLEDGSTIDLPLTQFNRMYEKIEADVEKIEAVPELEGRDGETYYRYTVKVLSDGRILTVDMPYIN